jgi:hypothetical protein
VIFTGASWLVSSAVLLAAVFALLLVLLFAFAFAALSGVSAVSAACAEVVITLAASSVPIQLRLRRIDKSLYRIPPYMKISPYETLPRRGTDQFGTWYPGTLQILMRIITV